MWESATQIKVERRSVVSNYGQHFLPMLVSFLLGCLGSILGCLAGFCLASRMPSAVIEHLKVCTACITASFIGGTVNFFEVAVALNSMQGELGRSLEMFAASDIGFMVVYFGGLLLLQKSPIAKAFPSAPSSSSSSSLADSAVEMPPLPPHLQKLIQSPREQLFTGLKALVNVLKLIAASLAITVFSAFVQQRLHLPGLSVILTVLITICSIRVLNPSNAAIFTSSAGMIELLKHS